MMGSTSVWLRVKLEQLRGPLLSRFRVSSVYMKLSPHLHLFMLFVKCLYVCAYFSVSWSLFSSLQEDFSIISFVIFQIILTENSTVFSPSFSLTQSMEATLTGRNGVHVAAPVDRASKNESDHATTHNQPMAADHAAVPVSTLGNVKLVSVQVWIHFCQSSFTLDSISYFNVTSSVFQNILRFITDIISHAGHGQNLYIVILTAHVCMNEQILWRLLHRQHTHNRRTFPYVSYWYYHGVCKEIDRAFSLN